jgi:hypothetical protein
MDEPSHLPGDVNSDRPLASCLPVSERSKAAAGVCEMMNSDPTPSVSIVPKAKLGFSVAIVVAGC